MPGETSGSRRTATLWVPTDGFFAVPTEGTDRGFVRQFLSVPRGAEACGPLITPDGRTMFCAVQHPGEVDGATPENPASTWPDGHQPRPSVAAI